DRWGAVIMGVPVKGGLDTLKNFNCEAVIAIGSNAVRQKIAQAYSAAWATLIHPRAWVDESSTVGPGTVVMAGAVIQPEARIGSHVIINTCASVDHECSLKDYAQISPGARLGGNVNVE